MLNNLSAKIEFLNYTQTDKNVLQKFIGEKVKN